MEKLKLSFLITKITLYGKSKCGLV